MASPSAGADESPSSRRDDPSRIASARGSALGEIVREGFLQKKGHLVRNWKRRWCQLTTSDLRYFEQGESEPRGIILMADIWSVESSAETGHFFVHTRSGKDFAFIADTNENRDAWMSAIEEARYRPSPLTTVLRQASRLFRSGKIDARTRDAVRDRVLDATDDTIRALQVRLDDVAARGGEDPARASEALEDSLDRLLDCSTERQLVDAFATLHRQLAVEDVSRAFRDRLIRACDRHRDRNPSLWTRVADEAHTMVLQTMRLRADDEPQDPHTLVRPSPKFQPGDAAPLEPTDAQRRRQRWAAAAAEQQEGGGEGNGEDEGAARAGRNPTEEGAEGATASSNKRLKEVNESGTTEDRLSPFLEPPRDPPTGDDGGSGGGNPLMRRLSSYGTCIPEGTPNEEDFRLLAEEERYGDVYDTEQVIGRGGYSIVHRAVHKETGEIVAAKFVDKARVTSEHSVLRSLYREIAIQKRIRHPHIVRLHGFFDEGDRWVMVAELMSGGELFDRIVKSTTYDERQARDVVKALAEALAFLHARNVAHRDLKPENILMASDDADAPLKLADLGFAASVPPSGLHTACGTPSYVAPEILSEVPYGVEVDCWSLGVIAFILLCGYAPFSHRNQAELFRRIRAGAFRFDPALWDSVSDAAKDLVRNLLVVNPSKRLSAEGVLAHPWITGTVGSAELRGVRAQMRAFNARRRRVVKTGLLVKQGHIIPSWKERSFVLYGDSLEYFEPRTFKPKGVIMLDTISDVVQLRRRGSFRIVTTTGRDLIIQAPDESEARDWIRAIMAQRSHSELMRRAEAAMRDKQVDNAVQLLRDAERYERYIDRQAERAGEMDREGTAGDVAMEAPLEFAPEGQGGGD